MRSLYLVVLLALIAFCAAVSAAEPGLPQAMAKLQGGDAAAAKTILTDVVGREPGNVRA